MRTKSCVSKACFFTNTRIVRKHEPINIFMCPRQHDNVFKHIKSAVKVKKHAEKRFRSTIWICKFSSSSSIKQLLHFFYKSHFIQWKFKTFRVLWNIVAQKRHQMQVIINLNCRLILRIWIELKLNRTAN